MTSAGLKAKAKGQLEGKRGNAALVLLVAGIVSAIANFILNKIFPGASTEIYPGIYMKQTSTIASILEFVITVFLGLGLTSYYMKITRGAEADISELFSKGSLLLKGIAISLIAGLLIGLASILFIIPGIILALAYSMATYIYLDNPEIGIIDALKESRTMMKGHKGQLFWLGLSFIGWIILGVFTFGILYFWLLPYMNVTFVNFYENIKESKEGPIEA